MIRSKEEIDMTKMKLASISLAAVMALGLAACGDTDSSTKDSTAASSTAASTAEGSSAEVKADANADAAAGFDEIPIFQDEEVGFMNVSAVYFQAVPMTDGNSIEDYDIHLEADVSALENKLGYGVGDWVPYLTVDYKVTDEASGDTAAEGTFMVMSASDGPHYGANIKMPNAGTYTVEFTFHSPAENNYLLHTDAETGPGGLFDDYFKDGNLTVKHEGWKYVPIET